MNLGIVLALASAVAYGSSDFVGGIGSRRYSLWQIVFVGQSAGAVAMVAAGLVLPATPVAADFAWAVLAGAGSAAGSIFLYRGLSRGRMGLVAPVSAVGAATLPVLAGVAFGDRPSLFAWSGMLVALPGIWLVSRSPDPERATDARLGIVDGGIAGVGFGVLFIALGQIADGSGTLPLAANQAVGAILALAAAAGFRQVRRLTAGVVGWGVASGLLGAFGTLAFLLATGLTDLGIAGVLASLYPVATVLLAAAVLGERVALPQRVGICICTVAIAAMALG